MNLGRSRQIAVDWGILLMVVLALVLGGFALVDRFRQQDGRAVGDRQVPGWLEYANEGNRIGPDNAAVTIIEFGDYECPFCQRVAPILQSVVEAHPGDVALVYRHLPLSYHRQAYPAARLAECAADQTWFAPVHQRLYELTDLSTLSPRAVGEAAGVPDLPRFLSCAADTAKVDRIEQDVAAARRLDVRSTPTILVNGLQLASLPDSAQLFELVREHLDNR